MQDIYVFVGHRIRQERKARGMTLEELASVVGMNTSFLHSIETARKKPSLRMVQKIANGLLVPVDRLLAGAPASAKPDPIVGRITAIVRDADDARRKTILKVVRTLVRQPKGA